MFSDRTVIPNELRHRGRLLAGEYVWDPRDVPMVVESLSDHGMAVVGFEIWEDRGGVPFVHSASDLEEPPANDWQAFVSATGAAVLADFRRRKLPPAALIQLTWITELDMKRMKGRER